MLLTTSWSGAITLIYVDYFFLLIPHEKHCPFKSVEKAHVKYFTFENLNFLNTWITTYTNKFCVIFPTQSSTLTIIRLFIKLACFWTCLFIFSAFSFFQTASYLFPQHNIVTFSRWFCLKGTAIIPQTGWLGTVKCLYSSLKYCLYVWLALISKTKYCNHTPSVCLSSVSSTCHALLDRFLAKDFSDQLLPHHLGSEDDSQSKIYVLTDGLTHTFAHTQTENKIICVIIVITCNHYVHHCK